jgi:hypothetical protein
VTQGVGLEFKLQYRKKKKKEVPGHPRLHHLKKKKLKGLGMVVVWL